MRKGGQTFREGGHNFTFGLSFSGIWYKVGT